MINQITQVEHEKKKRKFNSSIVRCAFGSFVVSMAFKLDAQTNIRMYGWMIRDTLKHVEFKYKLVEIFTFILMWLIKYFPIGCDEFCGKLEKFQEQFCIFIIYLCQITYVGWRKLQNHSIEIFISSLNSYAFGKYVTGLFWNAVKTR